MFAAASHTVETVAADCTSARGIFTAPRNDVIDAMKGKKAHSIPKAMFLNGSSTRLLIPVGPNGVHPLRKGQCSHDYCQLAKV